MGTWSPILSVTKTRMITSGAFICCHFKMPKEPLIESGRVEESMRIEAVDLFFISQPLIRPFVTSFGSQLDRDCLLVAVHSEGLTGWGECVATNDPGYSYETAGTAWHILSDFLIPALLGQELNEPEDLAGWFRYVRGHPLAKAALDQAAWDLTAQRDGLSFAQKLAAPYTKVLARESRSE